MMISSPASTIALCIVYEHCIHDLNIDIFGPLLPIDASPMMLLSRR